MFHHYDVTLNSKGGPTADVIIRAFNLVDDSIADIFADENGTPIESVSGIANAAKSNADGNYDFYIADGFYNLRFYIGDALVQTIRNVQLQKAGAGSSIIHEPAVDTEGQTYFAAPMGVNINSAPIVIINGFTITTPNYTWAIGGVTLNEGVSLGDDVMLIIGISVEQDIVDVDNVIRLGDADTADKVGFRSSLPTLNPAETDIASAITWRADVRMWNGVDLTGAADSTVAFQDAVNKAALAGQPLHIPAGTIRLTAPIEIPAGAVILGMSGMYMRATLSGRTVLHADHMGRMFTYTGPAGARHTAHLAVWREQPAFVSGWTPTDYDYDFYTDGATDCSFEDILFLGTTRGIRHTNGGGRFSHEKVWGQCYKNGILIDTSSDVTRSHKIHFWDFVSSGQAGSEFVEQYTLGNGEAAYYSKQNDNGVLIDFFAIFHRHSVRIGQFAGQTSKRFAASVIGTDATGSGISVDADANGFTAYFSHFYAHGHDTIFTDRSLIQVEGQNGDLRVYGKTDLSNAHRNGVRVTGTGSGVTLNDPNVVNYNRGSSGVDPAAYWAGTGIYGLTLRGEVMASGGTGGAPVYGGAGLISGAYRSHAPTLTASSGAITSYTVTNGSYMLVDGVCRVEGEIVITNNGTGAGDNRITNLPYPCNATYAGIGVVSNSAGKGGTVKVLPGSSTAIMNLADGTYPGGTGMTLYYNLEYRI